MININNILTQLNAKMAADIADSYNIPELVRRVEAYQKLNVDAGTVPEYHSFQELPDSDSANIGQIVFVKQKPAKSLHKSYNLPKSHTKNRFVSYRKPLFYEGCDSPGDMSGG